MFSLKQPLLLLIAIVCSAIFIAAIVDIVFYWPTTGYDELFLGKNILYAVATGYWVWRLLIKPRNTAKRTL